MKTKYTIYITIERQNEGGSKSVVIERKYGIEEVEYVEDLFTNIGVSVQDSLEEMEKDQESLEVPY